MRLPHEVKHKGFCAGRNSFRRQIDFHIDRNQSLRKAACFKQADVIIRIDLQAVSANVKRLNVKIFQFGFKLLRQAVGSGQLNFINFVKSAENMLFVLHCGCARLFQRLAFLKIMLLLRFIRRRGGSVFVKSALSVFAADGSQCKKQGRTNKTRIFAFKPRDKKPGIRFILCEKADKPCCIAAELRGGIACKGFAHRRQKSRVASHAEQHCAAFCKAYHQRRADVLLNEHCRCFIAKADFVDGGIIHYFRRTVRLFQFRFNFAAGQSFHCVPSLFSCSRAFRGHFVPFAPQKLRAVLILKFCLIGFIRLLRAVFREQP